MSDAPQKVTPTPANSAETNPAPAAEAPAAPAPDANPFAAIFDEQQPAEPAAPAEDNSPQLSEEEFVAAALGDEPAPASEGEPIGGESGDDDAEPPAAASGDGDAPSVDDPPARRPPWRVAQEERKAKQAEKLNSEWETRLAHQQQLWEAKQAAMEARIEALLARSEKPAQSDAIEIPDDPLKALEVIAKRRGKTATELYNEITDKYANGGEPGAKEALDLARQVQREAQERHEKLQAELKAKEEALKQREYELMRNGWVNDTATKALQTLQTYAPANADSPTPDEVWWLPYAPDTDVREYVQQRTDYWVAYAEKHHPGQVTTEQVAAQVAEEVDQRFERIYARFKPSGVANSSRPKESRPDAPEKPAQNSSRRSGLNNKDAAASSSKRPLTQAERDMAASKLFRQAIEG